MKKTIIIFITFIVVLLISIIIFRPNNSKIYLDDKYYNEGNFIEITSDQLNNIDSKNYVIFTFNNYCNFEKPCDQIFQEFMKKYKIDFLSISFEQFKKTKYYNEVKYAPSIIIVNNNKIVKYLDAEKDEDIERYQDVNKFKEWLDNYIYFTKKD